MDQTFTLGNSTKAEPFLRPAAWWAADCASQALALFEGEKRADTRPREAIAGAREFGHGGPRNKALRTLAWAAHAAAKESDQPSVKFAARSAMLAAAVAYTHTDLVVGKQGVNQARHLLGPAVYAALAWELASKGAKGVAEGILLVAADSIPDEVGILLQRFPPQPRGATRQSQLFHELDARVRSKSAVRSR